MGIRFATDLLFYPTPEALARVKDLTVEIMEAQEGVIPYLHY